ncbi:MAG: shikimate dehydrogenase [Lachnospiraceae bacterium]|nr:shikimate dehydrogenase [Lachnospiraceae bacterium]
MRQQIDGYTRLCGLIGNPVEHTMSPAIHNTLAEGEGRNLVYVPFHVERENLGRAIEGAYGLNVLGLNVTVPYKGEVIPFLKEIDRMAERIGAVNTLVRTDGGFKGYNTDMMGLYRAMRSENISIEGEEIILLGAGGAARAVAFMCASRGAARVWILNRTPEKAEAVAEEVNTQQGRECLVPMGMEDYVRLPGDRRYLAIQATSIGLYPKVDEAVIQDRDFYKKIHTGFDLIYRPSTTRFMTLVRESGGRAFHGLKMLLYQGVIAYELWNGISVSEEEALAVYAGMKEAMGIEE